MGGHRTEIVVVVFLLLLWATSISIAVDCDTVRGLISACSVFIIYGFPDPYPGTPCCEAVANMNLISNSVANRRSLCGCLMALLATDNPNSTAIATLPGFCGVSLGFTVVPNTDCNLLP